ncbi:MAG: sugar ABC transporter substrate-binding protein [Chloroflexota bacterium]|nr:sugar ABC transporter substrate-binding protein [Chloroflexota bacterium]
MATSRRHAAVSQPNLSRRTLLQWGAVGGAAAVGVMASRGTAAAGPGAHRPLGAVQNADLSAELEIWVWEGAIQGLQAVDPAFQAAYPNIKLKYVTRGTEDVYQQLQLSASAGSGGPDVAAIEDSHLAQFASLGVLADLTDRVEPYVEKINDFKWLQARVDDRAYAMPWDSGPCATFYRRDVFEKAGVDPNSIATWEDFYQVAKTVKEKTGLPMIQEAKARSSARTFEMMLWQRGLGYLDAEGNVILDTEPRVQETLEYLGRFWQEDLAADTEPWTDAWYKAYDQGTVATVPGAVWMGTFFKTWVAPNASGKWGVVPLPAWGGEETRSANDGGSALAIWGASEQQDAAWAYIEFHLGREDSQVTMYREQDLFPSLETTYTDPIFEEPDPYFGDQATRKVFAEAVTQIPAAGIYTANYQEMNALLVPEVQRYALGEQDAAQALKNAADAIRERV